MSTGSTNVGNPYMNKMMFLDLEETIIRSWHNPTLCNVDYLRYLLNIEKVTEVHIFSFAIWNQADKDHFSQQLKPHIEQALGVRIRSWVSVSEINKVIRQFTSTVLEDWELADVWGKLRAFQDYCRAQYKGMECVLIDDVVPNSAFILTDDRLMIRTIKVPVV